MSKTYKKYSEHGYTTRSEPQKRPKEALRHQIDEDLEELKRIRSPLYAWEQDRQSERLLSPEGRSNGSTR